MLQGVKIIGTVTLTDTGSTFMPAMDTVCASVAARFNRKWPPFRSPIRFSWEHIAERVSVRSVIHAFGWPRGVPFAELLKRQAKAIRYDVRAAAEYHARQMPTYHARTIHANS